jgi:hypothetical protein
MTMLHKAREIVKASRVLHSAYNALKPVLTVVPFYLFRERSIEKRKNTILPRMDIQDLKVGRLGPEDMKAIAAEARGAKYTEEALLKRLDDGWMCFGIQYSSRVIAWFWSYPYSCNSPLLGFPLREKEAYVTDLWTIEEFRGRNLAPYLRQKFYVHHYDTGYETIYAIMEYFNITALAYEKRLGFQPLSLHLQFILFKKFRFTIRLKQYEEPPAG